MRWIKQEGLYRRQASQICLRQDSFIHLSCHLIKKYLLTCSPNQDSDESARPHVTEWGFRQDCATAHADFNFRWAHMSDGTFSDVEADLKWKWLSKLYLFAHVAINTKCLDLHFCFIWTMHTLRRMLIFLAFSYNVDNVANADIISVCVIFIQNAICACKKPWTIIIICWVMWNSILTTLKKQHKLLSEIRKRRCTGKPTIAEHNILRHRIIDNINQSTDNTGGSIVSECRLWKRSWTET